MSLYNIPFFQQQQKEIDVKSVPVKSKLTFGPGGPGGPGGPWKETPENNMIGLLIISTTITSSEVKIYMKYTGLPHSLWVPEDRLGPGNQWGRENPVITGESIHVLDT